MTQTDSPPEVEYRDVLPRNSGKPWGSFLLTEERHELGRVEGSGTTVEDAINEAVGMIGNHITCEVRQPGGPRRSVGEVMADVGFITVWEGTFCRAVVVPQLDGRAKVVRIARDGGAA